MRLPCFHFWAGTEGIRVRHEGDVASCCLEFAPEVEVSEGAIRIAERDAGPPCLCPPVGWNLNVAILGLAPRAYDVYLLDEGDAILATAQLDVPETETQVFTRGDANNDEVVDISDAILVLNVLFAGERSVACRDAEDANDDGSVNISDPIYLLAYLFLGETEPPPPFHEPGEDSTDDPVLCGTEDYLIAADFIRGYADMNADGSFDVSDPIYLLQFILNGGTGVMCADAADVDDDGQLTISDVALIMMWMRSPISWPPLPTEFGPDLTPDRLGCACGRW